MRIIETVAGIYGSSEKLRGLQILGEFESEQTPYRIDVGDAVLCRGPSYGLPLRQNA